MAPAGWCVHAADSDAGAGTRQWVRDTLSISGVPVATDRGGRSHHPAGERRRNGAGFVARRTGDGEREDAGRDAPGRLLRYGQCRYARTQAADVKGHIIPAAIGLDARSGA